MLGCKFEAEHSACQKGLEISGPFVVFIMPTCGHDKAYKAV